ncbi:MAG: glycosyltransferase family 4 protein [bacterium]
MKNKNKIKIVMVDALVGNDYSLCLCASLQAAGMDVRLVVTEDRSEKTRVPLSFPLLKWSPSKNAAQGKFAKTLKYLRYLARLRREFARNKPDIVHFQFFRRERIESLFFALLRILRINLVYTAHDVFPPEKKRLDFLIKSLVYRSAKVIIVHSGFLKGMIVDTFGIDGEKIKIVPHGNFDHYLPEQNITNQHPQKVFAATPKRV